MDKKRRSTRYISPLLSRRRMFLSIASFLGTSLSLTDFWWVPIRFVTENFYVRLRMKTERGTIRIMPLGDSITYGTGSSYSNGYRAPLWYALVDAGIVNTQFVGSQSSGSFFFPERSHEGHPGWRIDQISSKISFWLTQYPSDIILLHIGTNDIGQRFAVDTVPTRLAQLIDQINALLPLTTILVAQIIPRADHAFMNQQTQIYNMAIPDLVQTRVLQGMPVQYVDMYDVVSVHDLADELHPNDNGYKKMASVWYNALLPILTHTYGWQASATGTAVSGSWEYPDAQTVRSLSLGVPWNQIFCGDIDATDYVIQIDVQFVHGGATSAFPKYGIYACYNNYKNFVLACLDQKKGVFVTNACIEGNWLHWQETDLPASFDLLQYHTLSAEKRGSTFIFFLDGLIQQTRVFPIVNGQVGLMTDDTAANFRNLIIQ